MNGVWTALVTPFTDQNDIDLPAFRRILHDQRDARVTGVIPCGTTGESPALSVEEKKLLIKTTLEELKGSGIKVFAGTGSNNTTETVSFSKWASDAGVDGVLVVTPYYNKPSQSGLEAHFKAVADAISCEVMLYNVPGRTGVSLTPSTISALANHPRISTLKEATGNVSFTSDIIDMLIREKREIDILSGDDATFLPLLSVGAVGVVSVVSNIIPRTMVAIYEHMTQNRVAQAQVLHKRYYPLFRDFFVEPNPVPVKHAMASVGLCGTHVRLPLTRLTEASVEKVDAALKLCGVAKGSAL
jgi:4-hydroxy-tetrahydrodipicolinate synthase